MIRLGKYRHYKAKEVKVIGVGKHSETLEDMVIYEEPTNNLSKLWIRPASMFEEVVESDGKKLPRFTHLEQNI